MPDEREQPLVLQHLGVVLAVVPLLVTAVRLGAVSHYDPSVALTVLQEADVFRLVMATMLPLVTLALFVLSLLAFVSFWQRGPQYRVSENGAYVLFGLALVTLLSAWAMSAPLLFALVPCLGGAALLQIWVSRKTGERSAVFFRVALAALLGAVFISLMFVDRPWLPAEIVRRTGSAPVVAYVVATDQRFTTLLQDNPRRILRVPSDTVTSRTPCRVKDDPGRTFGAVVRNQRLTSPSCPK